MKRKISIITLIAMLLCMIPSMAFAESTQSEMSWEKDSYSSQTNRQGGAYIRNVVDVNECEIKFTSSNQEVIPDDLLAYETEEKNSSVFLMFIGISEGQTDITATVKSKDGSVATVTTSVTVTSTEPKPISSSMNVAVGESLRFEDACGGAGEE